MNSDYTILSKKKKKKKDSDLITQIKATRSAINRN